ncbi:MAG: electron transfer flavoprotein alpha/ beta subunit, partial [Chloroflexi bacterium]|nr:electron transfer flavoprotein alpha/ beta subunit [Chloroflexota bacterium]
MSAKHCRFEIWLLQLCEAAVKIIVCIKQVPYIDQLKFDPATKRVIREGVESEINPFDKRALTHAIQLKQQTGAQVIVMTMGPPQAASALREALAMGADRAVHLLGREFAGADTLATARALAAAIRQIGFELILCGKYATDAETAQAPPMLAEMLDIPQITGVTRVDWEGNTFAATRELDNGFETLHGELPALMTAAERLCKPLRVTPQDMERVQAAPIEILQAAQLGDAAQFGLEGSPTWVEAIESIEPPRKRVIRQADDDIEKVVRETVDELMAEGLFGDWRLETHETILPGAVRPISEKAIWVVAEIIQDSVRPVTFELLGRAVQLADQIGGHVSALAIADHATQFAGVLAAHGADQIFIAEHSALTRYLTEPFTRILADAIALHKPFAVLLPSTANGRDLAPRVAARLNIGLTGDVIGLNIDAQGRLVQLKPAFGGNIVAPILSKTAPAMATIRPGILTPARADAGRRAEIIALPVNDVSSRMQWQ